MKVTREGQKWVTPAFVLYVFFAVKKSPVEAFPRIGFTVSKKAVSKKAVLRNKAKRRLREALRLVINDYNLDNAWVVVVARKEAVTHPFEQLQKDVRWALKRLNIEISDNQTKSEILAEAGIHGLLLLQEFRGLSVGQKICITLIKGYKLVLSPLAGGQCRYKPTCSDYMIQSIVRFGTIKGIWLGIKRIFRCAPWGGCGKDDVPETFSWFSKPLSSASVPHKQKNK